MNAQKLLKEVKAAKDKELKEAVAKYEKREQERARQEEKKLSLLEKKIQTLEAAGAGAAAAKVTVDSCLLMLHNPMKASNLTLT